MVTPDQVADALWAEYQRVDEWCRFEKDDPHSARVAIRCCATRLGVYSAFCAKDDTDPLEGFFPNDTKEGV